MILCRQRSLFGLSRNAMKPKFKASADVLIVTSTSRVTIVFICLLYVASMRFSTFRSIFQAFSLFFRAPFFALRPN